jgi:hypothetical protein
VNQKYREKTSEFSDRLLGRLEDVGADWIMGLYSNIALAPRPAVPFVYLDIDEETYFDWGEPLLLPRARLAGLVDRALEGRPRLLIIDIDLSDRGDTQGDATLAAVLERRRSAGSLPPILIARTLRAANSSPGSLYPRPRSSHFDAMVARAGNFYWAGVWLRTSSDTVVRRWPLWQLICTDEGRPEVLPSVGLATLALLADRGESGDALARQLADMAPANCTQPPRRQHNGLSIGGRDVPLGGEGRILFTIPWTVPRGEGRPLVATEEGGRAPVLTVIPARAFMGAEEGPQAGSSLDGAIVVIGGSYADGRDLHLTPIGRMPGALIVINAVYTALQAPRIALQPPPPLLGKLLAAGLIVLVAIAFTFCSTGLATLVSMLLAMSALTLSSWWLLGTGIWLDISVPLIGIIIHRWFASLEHWLGHQGWIRSRIKRLREERLDRHHRSDPPTPVVVRPATGSQEDDAASTTAPLDRGS